MFAENRIPAVLFKSSSKENIQSLANRSIVAPYLESEPMGDRFIPVRHSSKMYPSLISPNKKTPKDHQMDKILHEDNKRQRLLNFKFSKARKNKFEPEYDFMNMKSFG